MICKIYKQQVSSYLKKYPKHIVIELYTVYRQNRQYIYHKRILHILFRKQVERRDVQAKSNKETPWRRDATAKDAKFTQEHICTTHTHKHKETHTQTHTQISGMESRRNVGTLP